MKRWFVRSGTAVALFGVIAGSAVAAHAATTGQVHPQRAGHLQRLASDLGITLTQLQAELKTKTFAQIAQEHGTTLEALRAKHAAEVTARLKAKGWTDEQIQQWFANHHRHAPPQG